MVAQCIKYLKMSNVNDNHATTPHPHRNLQQNYDVNEQIANSSRADNSAKSIDADEKTLEDAETPFGQLETSFAAVFRFLLTAMSSSFENLTLLLFHYMSFVRVVFKRAQILAGKWKQQHTRLWFTMAKRK